MSPAAPKTRVSGLRDDPKPCPTCYSPMHLEGRAWVCDRHGVPTRP